MKRRCKNCKHWNNGMWIESCDNCMRGQDEMIDKWEPSTQSNKEVKKK